MADMLRCEEKHEQLEINQHVLRGIPAKAKEIEGKNRESCEEEAVGKSDLAEFTAAFDRWKAAEDVFEGTIAENWSASEAAEAKRENGDTKNSAPVSIVL